MMSEPLTYENFGQMIFDHMPYLIAGSLALIGITAGVLKKFGFLDFDKRGSSEHEICKHCSLVDGGSSKWGRAICFSHETLQGTVDEIRSTQMAMEQQQKTNMGKLNNGKEEFDKLHTKISNLNDKVTDLRIGIAVLLNHNKIKVKEFDDVKVQ